jgi:hypothetical protein
MKQNEATVACLSPLALLAFMEIVCGSAEVKRQIEDVNIKIKDVKDEIKGMRAALEVSKQSEVAIRPLADVVNRHFSELIGVLEAQGVITARIIDIFDAEIVKISSSASQLIKERDLVSSEQIECQAKLHDAESEVAKLEKICNDEKCSLDSKMKWLRGLKSNLKRISKKIYNHEISLAAEGNSIIVHEKQVGKIYSFASAFLKLKTRNAA